jgi:hypothetical protein
MVSPFPPKLYIDAFARKKRQATTTSLTTHCKHSQHIQAPAKPIDLLLCQLSLGQKEKIGLFRLLKIMKAPNCRLVPKPPAVAGHNFHCFPQG